MSHDRVRGGQRRWTAQGGTGKTHRAQGGREWRLPWREHCHFYLKTERGLIRFTCDKFRQHSEQAKGNKGGKSEHSAPSVFFLSTSTLLCGRLKSSELKFSELFRKALVTSMSLFFLALTKIL